MLLGSGKDDDPPEHSEDGGQETLILDAPQTGKNHENKVSTFSGLRASCKHLLSHNEFSIT